MSQQERHYNGFFVNHYDHLNNFRLHQSEKFSRLQKKEIHITVSIDLLIKITYLHRINAYKLVFILSLNISYPGFPITFYLRTFQIYL